MWRKKILLLCFKDGLRERCLTGVQTGHVRGERWQKGVIIKDYKGKIDEKESVMKELSMFEKR